MPSLIQLSRLISNRAKECVFVIVGLAAAWGVSGRLDGADWPQWRGPNHNDVSAETSNWPGGWPPRQLWNRNVGWGCTSPILVAGHLYVMGWQGNRNADEPKGSDTVYCLEALTGKELWRQSYPCPYWGRVHFGDESLYGGPTSTPVFDVETGYLYTLSIDGDLKCWDAHQQGRLVWSLNLYSQYKVPRRPPVDAEVRDYGYSCSPLIQGNLLLMEVGGNAGALVAFDKKTGNRVWGSACREPSGVNAGPVPMTVEGVPCVACFGIRQLTVIRTDKGHEGMTLAEFPWRTQYGCNTITPAIQGNQIILTSGHNVERTALLDISPGGAKELWNSRRCYSETCSPVIYGDSVYLAAGPFFCLSLADGTVRWRGGHPGREASCLVTAGDDKVIVLGSGALVLVDASPGAKDYHELSRVDQLITGTCYPHIILSDGILCCKSREGELVCLSVRKHS